MDRYGLCILNRLIIVAICLWGHLSLCAQTDWYRLLTGTIKAGQAVMITDEQLAESVKEEVTEMDRQNTVCASGSRYAQRLRRITKGMKDADGIELNFKVLHARMAVCACSLHSWIS